MTLDILRAAARPATPWRNGGGVTREVATDGGTPFRWRLSLADVAADGPFSAFDGYHRVITLVRGAGMRLVVDGVPEVIDRPYRPFAFDGGAATECTLLGGPVVDFNVMSTTPARVEVSSLTGDVPLPPGAVAVVLGGAALLVGDGVVGSGGLGSLGSLGSLGGLGAVDLVGRLGVLLGEFDAVRAGAGLALAPVPTGLGRAVAPVPTGFGLTTVAAGAGLALAPVAAGGVVALVTFDA